MGILFPCRPLEPLPLLFPLVAMLAPCRALLFPVVALVRLALLFPLVALVAHRLALPLATGALVATHLSVIV